MIDNQERTCPICGKGFYPQLEKQKYCSTECGLCRLRIRMRKCAFCGEEFWSQTHENFCKEDCKSKFFENPTDRKFRYSERELICKNCGKIVNGKMIQEHQEFCSYVCQRRYYSKIGNVKRKAQMEKQFVEKVTLDEIYQRDKGICQICGLPVDRTLKVNNRYSPTIDHIIPLSKNGLHEKSNCQLAHRSCNSSKGDKILTEEIKIRGGDYKCQMDMAERGRAQDAKRKRSMKNY